MLKKIIILFCVTLSLNFASTTVNKPVSNFNVNKYAGQWYEIIRTNNYYERNCTNVTATYTPNAKGMDVLNYCYKAGKGNKLKTVAKFKQTNNIADFKVTVFWVFSIGYRVLYVDNDYQYAIVDSGNLDYVWVLARTPHISTQKQNELVNKVEEFGFDITDLHYTQHTQ